MKEREKEPKTEYRWFKRVACFFAGHHHGTTVLTQFGKDKEQAFRFRNLVQLCKRCHKVLGIEVVPGSYNEVPNVEAEA